MDTPKLNMTKLQEEKEKLQNKLAVLQSNLDAAKELVDSPKLEEPSVFGPLNEKLKSVFQKSQVAVVRVQIGSRLSSGFLVSPEGHVLTVQHALQGIVDFHGRVVDKNINILVTTSAGETFDASLLASNETLDVALLKLNEPHPFWLEISTERYSANDEVVSVGYFKGIQISATGGRIIRARKNVILYRRGISEKMIGTAGGPLLTTEGKVIGLHHAAWEESRESSIWTAEAIRIDRILEFLGSHPSLKPQDKTFPHIE